MKSFKFIDLFSGIGGFRLALEDIGGECVYSIEIDDHAKSMYEKNFSPVDYNDITRINPELIPDFDLLCGGFPCQAFSQAGKQEGFKDQTRGTLFFDICRILEIKKPKYFILENVKNLVTHDKGNTMFVILKSLSELGYAVSYEVLNARNFGLPQNRERTIIIGSLDGKVFNFKKLNLTKIYSMRGFLDKDVNFEYMNPEEYTLIEDPKKQSKSGLKFVGYRNKKMRSIGVRPNTEHLSRVHKQPNRIYSIDGTHPTLSAQEKSGRYFILDDNGVRKLTINECYRFMGFPENFKKIGTDSQLYERIGNSIAVPMVREIGKEMINQFCNDRNELTVEEFLEDIYQKGSTSKLDDVHIDDIDLENLKVIVEKAETNKGVYSVLLTSLVYKSLNPQQDVRYHQANMEGGYSGRSFDTKYITPFLKSKKISWHMKESGWLTRSLEQNLPYDLDYPGKINNKQVKKSFLTILDRVETEKVNVYNMLLVFMILTINQQEKNAIEIINPIERESVYQINQIIELLNKHFYYPNTGRGTSILPVIALHSIYQCITKELKRYNGKYLMELNSHTSSDQSSGDAGDIVIRNEDDDSLYEVVEVKFDIPIDKIMIEDAYNKIKTTSMQRYYILSTSPIDKKKSDDMYKLIEKIKDEHGCQVIINGIFPTLKYYLRLISNTDDFINNYIELLESDPEINYQQKIAWNNIVNL